MGLSNSEQWKERKIGVRGGTGVSVQRRKVSALQTNKTKEGQSEKETAAHENRMASSLSAESSPAPLNKQ